MNVSWGVTADNLNKEIIFTASDGSTVTYNSTNAYEISTSDSVQVNVSDKNYTYNATISHYAHNNNVYDWTTEGEADKNHLAILKGEHASGSNNYFYDINANIEHNVVVTDGGARLVYRYNGGNDIVNSNAVNANDLYRINSFNSTSSLIINDRDEYDPVTYDELDNDTVIFSEDALDKTRIFFNISREEFTNNEFAEDLDSLIFMNKNVAESLSSSWENETCGVIKINGVNMINYYKDVNDNEHRINVTSWVNNIKQDIVNWLTTKGYDSTSEVFTAEKADGDIEALIAKYNKSYDTVMNA